VSGRSWIAVGATLGGLGVVAGAFGAHGLEDFFAAHTSEALDQTYEIAVRYQMYHALALVLTGMLAQARPGRWLDAAGWCFTFGVLLFSGLLYALVFSGVTILGAIVPIGGVAMIAGWFALAVASLREPKDL
jgi:uncharacterized membrane protein YgdD (TMEM256/DUF423 family)